VTGVRDLLITVPRVDQLFDGEPAWLPQWREPTSRRVITAEEAGAVAPPVRHALGYDQFVTLAAQYGTAAKSLFDFWAFAHFIRAHRDRFRIDRSLTSSAVVFLGNVCIANHPECYWTSNGPSLAVESAREVVDDEQGVRSAPADHRYLGVGDTVPAILEADEDRFLEFQSVVEAWRPGAPVPRARHQPHRDHAEAAADQ
jgi:hypothetical protein